MHIPSLVVDASVFAKWFLQDESEREQALLIQKDFLQEAVSIDLPLTAIIEVNNIFKNAVLRKRIREKQALQIYEKFLKFDFVSHSSDEILQRTLQTAITLDISSYDASYVALAESLQIPFYTADERLVRKAKSNLVISLKEYAKSEELE